MSAQELAFLAVRALVIMFAFQTLPVFAMSFISFENLPPLVFTLYIITVLVFFVFAIFLWYGASFVARIITPPVLNEDQKISSITKEDLLLIAIVIMGVFFVYKAIRPFSSVAVTISHAFIKDNWTYNFWGRGFADNLIESALFLTIGFYFIFSSRGFTALILKLRGRA